MPSPRWEETTNDGAEEKTPMHDFFTVRETEDGEFYVHVSRPGQPGCESERFERRQEALDWVAAEFPDVPERQH